MTPPRAWLAGGDAGAPRSRGLVDAVRAVLAIGLLAATVGGLPVALWVLGRELKPTRGLDPSHIASMLTRADDGSLLLLALWVVGWVGWALFTLSVSVEVVALVRGVTTPRLPWLTLPQRGAAVLIAAAALLATPAGSSLSSPPVPHPLVATAFFDVATSQPLSPASESTETYSSPEPAQESAESETAASSGRRYPTVTVRRHDTLWSLAQTHLGSGKRFSEIVALNLGRTQPDGRALTKADWIFPGWVLRLPPDARMDPRSRTADKAASDASMEAYTVERGDSLWEIADEHLGAGERYAEIYQLNVGNRQADGMQLTDPDEIRPGWRLRLPTTLVPVVPDSSGVPSSPGVESLPAPAEVPPLPPPRTHAPVTSGQPSSTPAPTRESSSGSNENGAVVSPALVLGLCMIVLTGLSAELMRRRKLQQRNRSLGERIAMPPAGPAAAEQKARAASDPVTIDTLKLALRNLCRSCRDAGRTLPDVMLVRVTSSSIELVLRDEDRSAVEPFRSVDAITWRLESIPASPIDEDVLDPFPALVTVGVEGDRLVLLNLEAIGALTLTGPEAAREPVLRALAAELAVGPLTRDVTLTFIGVFSELANVVGRSRGRFVEDTASGDRVAVLHAESVRSGLERSGAAGIRDARARGIASDVSGPEVLIAAEQLPNLPADWCGVTAVTASEPPVDERKWALVARPDGSARLEPPGIEIFPQTLTVRDYEHLVCLLATADTVGDHESGGHPSTAGDLVKARVAALDALPQPVEGEKYGAVAEAVPPRVLLLGTVHVDGADDGSVPGRRRRASELVAYLTLHPGASPHELDEAMWPGRRVAKNTRNPFVSRVRHWLGRTPDGEPYLPLVADGGEYRLRPEVTCDWHDFLRLAHTGLSQGAEGVVDLAAALDLVRGRPFLGTDPVTYTWAEADTQEMISAIVDVAHVLSVTRCEFGDHRGAQEAAARGLLVEPYSELLYRDAIKAAAARGDHAEVDRLANRLRHELALIDPEDGIADETAALLSAIHE